MREAVTKRARSVAWDIGRTWLTLAISIAVSSALYTILLVASVPPGPRVLIPLVLLVALLLFLELGWVTGKVTLPLLVTVVLSPVVFIRAVFNNLVSIIEQTPRFEQTQTMQIRQTIELIGTHEKAFDDCEAEIKVATEHVDALRVRINYARDFNVSTARAVAWAIVLIAVFVLDYIQFYPVIDFLLTYAFRGTREPWQLDAARIIIPLAFLIVELDIAYYRTHARSALGLFTWWVASIQFGATVPVALAATFYAAFANPDPQQGFALDARVFWLLLFFLVSLASISHYLVILRGESIILALQICKERLDLIVAESHLKHAQNRQSIARRLIAQSYERYRLLVYDYLSYHGGEPYNSYPPFPAWVSKVLKEAYPIDKEYLDGQAKLYTWAK